ADQDRTAKGCGKVLAPRLAESVESGGLRRLSHWCELDRSYRTLLMISRRRFLAVACALPSVNAKRKFSVPMGLEMYSLRREAEKDLPATLALIREFGFKEVEGGDFHGRSATEFRKLLDRNGVRLTSMMAAYDRLSRDINSVADDAQSLGAEYVVCSTVPPETCWRKPACLLAGVWSTYLPYCEWRGKQVYAITTSRTKLLTPLGRYQRACAILRALAFSSTRRQILRVSLAKFDRLTLGSSFESDQG